MIRLSACLSAMVKPKWIQHQVGYFVKLEKSIEGLNKSQFQFQFQQVAQHVSLEFEQFFYKKAQQRMYEPLRYPPNLKHKYTYQYQSKILKLGFILIRLQGTMSQLDYLEDYQPPSPPRFKPMSLPYLQEFTLQLQLDQSSEDENLGRFCDVSRGKSTRNLSKSSVLKFLGQKPKMGSKYHKEMRQ